MKYFGYTTHPAIKIMLAALLFAIIPNSAIANSDSIKGSQKLKIVSAVMPAVPPVSRTSAVYLTVQNLSDQIIVLDTIETEIARHAMFHQTVEENGVAKMNHLSELVIPAKQSLNLVSGGIHIMLMGLKEIPKDNQFKLSLGNSEKKYHVTVKVIERIVD